MNKTLFYFLQNFEFGCQFEPIQQVSRLRSGSLCLPSEALAQAGSPALLSGRSGEISRLRAEAVARRLLHSTPTETHRRDSGRSDRSMGTTRGVSRKKLFPHSSLRRFRGVGDMAKQD